MPLHCSAMYHASSCGGMINRSTEVPDLFTGLSGDIWCKEEDPTSEYQRVSVVQGFAADEYSFSGLRRQPTVMDVERSHCQDRMMNTFAIETIWYGVVALVGGAALMMIEDYPPGDWQGPIALGLGCILIFVGGRNLFKPENNTVASGGLTGSSQESVDGGRSNPNQIVASAVAANEGRQPEHGSSNITGEVPVTIVLVGVFLAVAYVGISEKVESDLEKRRSAKSERHVLDTLSVRAASAEDFVMSAAEVPEPEQNLIRHVRELLQAGDYQAAINRLTAANETNASFGGRLFYLGYALHHSNRNQEAVDVLSKFIEYQDVTNAYDIYRRDTRYYKARALSHWADHKRQYRNLLRPSRSVRLPSCIRSPKRMKV